MDGKQKISAWQWFAWAGFIALGFWSTFADHPISSYQTWLVALMFVLVGYLLRPVAPPPPPPASPPESD